MRKKGDHMINRKKAIKFYLTQRQLYQSGAATTVWEITFAIVLGALALSLIYGALLG